MTVLHVDQAIPGFATWKRASGRFEQARTGEQKKITPPATVADLGVRSAARPVR